MGSTAVMPSRIPNSIAANRGLSRSSRQAFFGFRTVSLLPFHAGSNLGKVSTVRIRATISTLCVQSVDSTPNRPAWNPRKTHTSA